MRRCYARRNNCKYIAIDVVLVWGCRYEDKIGGQMGAEEVRGLIILRRSDLETFGVECGGGALRITWHLTFVRLQRKTFRFRSIVAGFAL